LLQLEAKELIPYLGKNVKAICLHVLTEEFGHYLGRGLVPYGRYDITMPLGGLVKEASLLQGAGPDPPEPFGSSGDDGGAHEIQH